MQQTQYILDRCIISLCASLCPFVCIAVTPVCICYPKNTRLLDSCCSSHHHRLTNIYCNLTAIDHLLSTLIITAGAGCLDSLSAVSHYLSRSQSRERLSTNVDKSLYRFVLSIHYFSLYTQIYNINEIVN